METTSLVFGDNMLIAAAILAAAYVLIFMEIIHRTTAAIIGAVVMVGIGQALGFYTQEEAILSIDGNTILLLAAMMMLVALLRPTGAFEWAAIRITKLALPFTHKHTCHVQWQDEQTKPDKKHTFPTGINRTDPKPFGAAGEYQQNSALERSLRTF